jgi:hypothetical protein
VISKLQNFDLCKLIVEVISNPECQELMVGQWSYLELQDIQEKLMEDLVLKASRSRP